MKMSAPHSCLAAALAPSALALRTLPASLCRLVLPAKAGSVDSWDGPKTVPIISLSRMVRNRNSRGWKGSHRPRSSRPNRGRHHRRRLPSRCDESSQRRWRQGAAHTQLQFGFLFPPSSALHASSLGSRTCLHVHVLIHVFIAEAVAYDHRRAARFCMSCPPPHTKCSLIVPSVNIESIAPAYMRESTSVNTYSHSGLELIVSFSQQWLVTDPGVRCLR